MAIRVEKDGWTVSADTLEELEIGIMAVQRALQAPPKRGRGRPPGKTENGHATDKHKQEQKRKITLAFLRTINGAEKGVTADDLVAARKLKHKRALGSPVGIVNRTLESLEFEPTTVFIAEKKFGEPRRWYPRGRIRDAIEAVENSGADS